MNMANVMKNITSTWGPYESLELIDCMVWCGGGGGNGMG